MLHCNRKQSSLLTHSKAWAFYKHFYSYKICSVLIILHGHHLHASMQCADFGDSLFCSSCRLQSQIVYSSGLTHVNFFIELILDVVCLPPFLSTHLLQHRPKLPCMAIVIKKIVNVTYGCSKIRWLRSLHTVWKHAHSGHSIVLRCCINYGRKFL